MRHVLGVVDLLGEAGDLLDDAQGGCLLGRQGGVSHRDGRRGHSGVSFLGHGRHDSGCKIFVRDPAAHARWDDVGNVVVVDLERRVVAPGLDRLQLAGDHLVEEGPVDLRAKFALLDDVVRCLRDRLRRDLRAHALDLDGDGSGDCSGSKAVASPLRRLIGHGRRGDNLRQRDGVAGDHVGIGDLIRGCGDVDPPSVLAEGEDRRELLVVKCRLDRTGRHHLREPLDACREYRLVDHDHRVHRGGAEDAHQQGRRVVEAAGGGVDRGDGIEAQPGVAGEDLLCRVIGGDGQGGTRSRSEVALQGGHRFGARHAADLDSQDRGVGGDVGRGTHDHPEVEDDRADDGRPGDEDGQSQAARVAGMRVVRIPRGIRRCRSVHGGTPNQSMAARAAGLLSS